MMSKTEKEEPGDNKGLLLVKLVNEKRQLKLDMEQLNTDYEEAKRQIEHLTALHKIGKLITSALDIDKVLTSMVEAAVSITEADAGALMLLDEHTQELYLRAQQGFEEEYARNFRSKIVDTIAGEVISSGTPQRVLGMKGHIKVGSGHLVKAVLYVPLIIEGEVVGVFYVGKLIPERPFTDEDEHSLLILADYAANAIQHAHRVRQERLLRQQAEKLRKAAITVSTAFDLKELAEKLLDALEEVIEYQKATVQLINGDERELLYCQGMSADNIGEWLLRPISQDKLASRIVADKEPLIVSDTSKEEFWDYHEKTADVKSWIGLPLIAHSNVIGIVTLDHREAGYYSDTLKDLLSLYCNQLAATIENVQLYENLQRRYRDLEIVNNVSRIMSNQLDTEALLKEIVSQIAHHLNCSHCTIFLLEKEDGDLEEDDKNVLVPQVTNGGFDEILSRRFKPGEGLVGWVFQEGESLLLEDVTQDQRFLPTKQRKRHPRSMLLVPIRVGSRAIGVISADQDKYGWFNNDGLRLVEMLARQAGIAIERSIGLELLHEIGNQIISGNVRNVYDTLNKILSGAIRLTNTTTGIIHVTGRDDKSIVGSFHYPPEYKHPPPRRRGITYTVASTSKPVTIPDIQSDPRVNRELRKYYKSMIGIPLKYENKVIGVLFLNDSKPHHFTEIEVSLLTTLASQAAIAIQNARTHTYLQTLVQNSPIAIIAVDRDGNITEFNKASEQMLKYSEEEVLGEPISKFYYRGKEEARRVNRILLDNEQKGKVADNIDTAARDKDGENVPIRLAGIVLRDEFGTHIGSMGLLTDLREIEAFDRKYKREQGFLNRLENYLHDEPINSLEDLRERLNKQFEKVCIFCGLEYVFLFASTEKDQIVLPAIAGIGIPTNISGHLPHFNWKMAGLQPQEDNNVRMLQGEAELIAGWWPDETWRQRIISGIKGENSEFFTNISCGVPVRLANNYRGVLVYGPFDDDQSLAGKVDLLRNIAQSITLNCLGWLQALYLHERSRDAERSSKLIVHRTQTYLTQILGKFGRVLGNINDSEIVKESAEFGEQLVLNLGNVVKRALRRQVTHLEDGDLNFQSYPLPVLVQNCVESFRQHAAAAKKELRIDESIEFLPYAFIDPAFLTMALANLIENAIKYSFEGTYIKVYSKHNAKEATITVQNLGERMPEDAHQNLIEPGQRWTARRENIPGMGYGLWDASLILDVHNGQVDFYSIKCEKPYRGRKAYVVRTSITFPFEHNKS